MVRACPFFTGQLLCRLRTCSIAPDQRFTSFFIVLPGLFIPRQRVSSLVMVGRSYGDHHLILFLPIIVRQDDQVSARS